MIKAGLTDNQAETERKIEQYCLSVEKLLNNINEKSCSRKKIYNTFDEDIEFMDDDDILL